MPSDATNETDVTENGSRTITIQGKTFTVPQPYAEGHVCTAGEAAGLNQLIAENARNNFATQMKAAAEENPPRVLTQDDLDKYLADYKMGGKGGTRASSDPVGAEERKLADAAIAAWAAKNNKTQKALKDSGQWEQMQKAIVTKGTFRAKAEEIVAARRSAGAELDAALDDISATADSESTVTRSQTAE